MTEELHAKISPSAFQRVRLCPGSLRLCESIPDRPDSDASREGTACHEAAERHMNADPARPGEKMSNGITLTKHHLLMVKECVDWIEAQNYARLATEVRVPVGQAIGMNDPDLFWGTSDVIGHADGCMDVVDFKFGYGPVDPRNNDQMWCYLLGAIQIYGPARAYRMVIIQPRAGGVKTWEVPTDWVEDTRRSIAALTAEALAPDAPLKPGPVQCRFCPAAGICPAQRDTTAVDTSVPAEAMDDAALGAAMDRVEMLRAYCDAVERQALARAELGHTIPGWKRVAGQSRRTWIDPEDAIDFLVDQGFDPDDVAPRKLGTLGDLERVIGKPLVEELTHKPEGKPKMVRDEDSRPALDGDFKPL